MAQKTLAMAAAVPSDLLAVLPMALSTQPAVPAQGSELALGGDPCARGPEAVSATGLCGQGFCLGT